MTGVLDETEGIGDVPPAARSAPPHWVSWAGLVTATFSVAVSLATAVGATVRSGRSLQHNGRASHDQPTPPSTST